MNEDHAKMESSAGAKRDNCRYIQSHTPSLNFRSRFKNEWFMFGFGFGFRNYPTDSDSIEYWGRYLRFLLDIKEIIEALQDLMKFGFGFCMYMHWCFIHHDNTFSPFSWNNLKSKNILKSWDVIKSRVGSGFEIIPGTEPTNFYPIPGQIAGHFSTGANWKVTANYDLNLMRSPTRLLEKCVGCVRHKIQIIAKSVLYLWNDYQGWIKNFTEVFNCTVRVWVQENLINRILAWVRVWKCSDNRVRIRVQNFGPNGLYLESVVFWSMLAFSFTQKETTWNSTRLNRFMWHILLVFLLNIINQIVIFSSHWLIKCAETTLIDFMISNLMNDFGSKR